MTPHDQEFTRDPGHWLRRLSPQEWIAAALGEFTRAKTAILAHDRTAALAGLKRAAGQALNAALLVRPNESWGRSYVDHLMAVQHDLSVPEEVRAAARQLLDPAHASREIVPLRTPAGDQLLLEAAQTIMAHAYAMVHGSSRLRTP